MLSPDDYPTADDYIDAWDDPDDEYDTERAYYDGGRYAAAAASATVYGAFYTDHDGTTTTTAPEFDCS